MRSEAVLTPTGWYVAHWDQGGQLKPWHDIDGCFFWIGRSGEVYGRETAGNDQIHFKRPGGGAFAVIS